jgi:acyl carrier protein
MTDLLLNLRSCLPSELDPTVVGPETRFDSVRLDSLSFLQLVVDVEDKFDVVISNEEAKRLKTVGDLLTCLSLKLS